MAIKLQSIIILKLLRETLFGVGLFLKTDLPTFDTRHCGFKSPALGNITSFLNLKKKAIGITNYTVVKTVRLDRTIYKFNITSWKTSGHLAPSTVRGANKRGKEDKVENLKTKTKQK